MNKALIYHRPLSEYAHAIDKNTLVIRIRVGKDDMKDINLMYGDTAFQGNPVQFTKLSMVKIASDQFFDYYEGIIKDGYERTVYYFDITGKDLEHTYYYADIFTNELTVERNDLFKFPFNRIEDICDIPEWFKDAVIYNIFLDSYTNDENHEPTHIKENDYFIKNKHGGTIRNVINNLDHIKSMGFNTIYLNPIFKAGEYHKYDTIDYYQIDPLFGTNEDFKELVDLIHEKGMYIIIDGVFNHSGWYFKPFDDVIKNQEKSVYKDWFYRLDFPIKRPELGVQPSYATFGYERLMPKLNTGNKEVIEYFMDVCRYWMEEYKIDGWRLDVADEVNTDFWRSFRKVAKSINPNSVIIGEVWQDATFFLDGSMFDSAMNYDFIKYAKAFFAERTNDSDEFNHRLTKLYLRYRTNLIYGQMNILDTHDVPRFLSLVKENVDLYKLALILLLTFVGVPSIFYGDEEGLTGIIERDFRRPLTQKNDELRKFFIDIISLRNNHDAIRRGRYEMISHKDNLIHYKRFTNKEEIHVILNNSNLVHEIIIVEESEVLLSAKYNNGSLHPFGFVIYKK